MSRHLRDYRGVGKPVGAVVLGLGLTIGLCALAGLLFDAFSSKSEIHKLGGESELAAVGGATMVFGFLMYLFGHRYQQATLTRREAILSVALIWISAGVFGAMPFVVVAHMSFTDALFEAISGLTTTGATVVTDIEGSLPRALLLWRSLIQWLGGMGIVVLFVAVFPNIGAGGKHMFTEEVPGTSSEGLRPRIAETSRELWKFYALFTTVEVFVLFGLGMSGFEAVCHALTTMSTGGFSTRNASIAAFDSPAIEFAIAAFMLLGSVNYALYYAAFRGRGLKPFFRSVEFQAFVLIVVLSISVLTIGILEVHNDDLFEAFRYAVFMVATTISSTGYGTDAYMGYPDSMLMVVLLLMFIGGCAGSTAGGIKIERIVMMCKVSLAEIRRSFRPNLVHVIRMGRSVVSQDAITDATVFFIIYMVCMGVFSTAIVWIEEIGLPTAFGAVLSCLSNMGPAPFHLKDDNFAAYSSASKLVFTVAMLLGRLEFFALLSLLVPGFWRR